MGDFLDPFLSSSSAWSDMNETERSSWVGPADSEENGLSAAPVRACKGDECVILSESNTSVFPKSIGDAHSMSALWSPSYSGVSTEAMGLGKAGAFGLQGEFFEADDGFLGKSGLANAKFPLVDIFPTALDGLSEMHNPSHLPSFTAGSGFNSASFQSHQQLLQTSEANSFKNYAKNSAITQSQSVQANGASSNGAVKPRVRARRGQATDPHSIAERLRREKISERMKNLQELVPNSNKTDKASMLDEIIDYVKFLQLQVKVLSMSRLGAAGAIVPLITDAQPEGSNSLLMSSSVGQGVADITESMDSLALEQEVIKLLESNITMAMQYLQNKGLCLMPIALAAAISGRKGSSCAIPPERRKSEISHGAISQNSKSTEEWNGRRDGTNGSNGAVVKQEEAQKPECNIRELKSRA